MQAEERYDDQSDQRLLFLLTHTLHVTMALLLSVAVVRAWQLGEHPWAATGLALAMVVAYLLSRHWAGLLALLALWAVAAALSSTFAWVAFGLYFLVLHAFPRRIQLVPVALVAAWSVWITGAFLGPVIGALVAVLSSGLFGQQRGDALRHRALVAKLRAAQETLATTERARGVLAERERLAREIHDTVGQGLASIVMLSRTAQQGDAGALELIETTARDNLTDVRRLIRGLGAQPGEVGLTESLRALCDDTRRRSAAAGCPLAVELTVDGTPRPLPSATADALQRGAQASVANVVQHAAATRCRIGLAWFADRVVVDIVDDGGGFDPGAVGPDSYGLRALRDRMAALGGTVDVDTKAGEGTTVALSVPTPEGAA